MFRSARKSTADLLAHTGHQHHLKSQLDDTKYTPAVSTATALDELRRALHGLAAHIAYTLAATIRPRS